MNIVILVSLLSVLWVSAPRLCNIKVSILICSKCFDLLSCLGVSWVQYRDIYRIVTPLVMFSKHSKRPVYLVRTFHFSNIVTFECSLNIPKHV